MPVGAGNVYVFNVASEDLTLSTNGLAAGLVDGWSTSGSAKYQPASIAVPRTLNGSDGPAKFVNGPNYLVLVWIEGLFTANVEIDGAVPLNQDLLLFVTQNQWQLVSASGIALATGNVQSCPVMEDVSEPGAGAVRPES